MTLRTLLKELNEMAEENPKLLDALVIYSHDDEGNEYQEVINSPLDCFVEPHEGYRDLQVEFESDPDKSNAICIN